LLPTEYHQGAHQLTWELGKLELISQAAPKFEMGGRPPRNN